RATGVRAGKREHTARPHAARGAFKVGTPQALGVAVEAPPQGRESTIPHAPELEAERPAPRPRLAGPGEEELDARAPRARPSIDLGHTVVGPRLEERGLAVAPAVESHPAPPPFRR